LLSSEFIRELQYFDLTTESIDGRGFDSCKEIYLEISSPTGKPLGEKITGKRINADIFATGGSMDKLAVSDV
jgi:hypothetical protein